MRCAAAPATYTLEVDMVVDDSDFLTNPSKQLQAVRELSNLNVRMVDLETERARLSISVAVAADGRRAD